MRANFARSTGRCRGSDSTTGDAGKRKPSPLAPADDAVDKLTRSTARVKDGVVRIGRTAPEQTVRPCGQQFSRGVTTKPFIVGLSYQKNLVGKVGIGCLVFLGARIGHNLSSRVGSRTKAIFALCMPRLGPRASNCFSLAF